MTIKSVFADVFECFKGRAFLITWISLVIYLFYDTFIYYQNGLQYYHLRRILGLGLCISRATASVLNLCGALILLPQCKKLNQILYRLLSRLWPRLFFVWLETAKSFHMTVATTLVTFGVLHSASHLVNLWNFSRGFDEERREINLARYKNENPLLLLLCLAGITGVLMLLSTLCMGLTSLRIVRRRMYNAFWYAHQLYLPFMGMFLIHPLSGLLKEEIIDDKTSISPSHSDSWNNRNSTVNTPRFAPIKSKTWLWMSIPLACFFLDLLWRICSRNRAVVDILEAKHMAGRTISLTISCANFALACRAGQYVVLQCPRASLIEWHPFTIVKVPTSYQRSFVVWIRVKGDWTEALEKLLKENGPREISLLVDGPFSSPMEAVSGSEVALCVAAGVGITPFVSVLHQMLMYPRSRLPGRIHLIWIVRDEHELTWLADLADKTISQLRNANRPDRLHLQLYVTKSTVQNLVQNPTHMLVLNEKGSTTHKRVTDDEMATLLTPHLKRACVRSGESDSSYPTHKLVLNEKGSITHKRVTEDEKATLLTPHLKRACDRNVSDSSCRMAKDPTHKLVLNEKGNINRRVTDDEMATLLTPHLKRACDRSVESDGYSVAKDYPLLGCRVRRGRPHWDQVFGYWVHLYPEYHLKLYCCGPKKLVKVLKNMCKIKTRTTKTTFTFVHESFS